MRKIVSIIFGCLLSVMLISISSATGADAIALISSFKGKVEVQRAHQKEFRAIHLGEELFEKDIIYTHKSSRASLLFSDGSVVSVYPDSRVELSLGNMDKKKGGSVVQALSREVLKGFRGIFSASKGKETLSSVPGIRKKIEEEEKGVRVLYPRNSMILSSRPHLSWKTQGKDDIFMVSLTLKGMGGKLWTIQSEQANIPYPEGQKELDRGQTYFLRVEKLGDPSLYDEVYFRILDSQEASEVMQFTNKMKGLRKANPNDSSPSFILSEYYEKKGLYHEASEELEALEKEYPKERFILEKKREIFSKMGYWKKLEEANQKLNAIK